MFARAEKYYVFALVCGEFETLYRRANAVRPYDIIKYQYDKLKFNYAFFSCIAIFLVTSAQRCAAMASKVG